MKFVSQAQRVAVVAHCWRKGMDAEETAEYLRLSVAQVESIFGHVEWTYSLSAAVDESAQPTPPPDGVSSESASTGP